jgi:methionyl-tRNA synthetase
MPESAAKLLDQLGVPQNARSFAALGPKGRLQPGTELPPPEPVFPRHVEESSEAAAS